MKTNDQLSKMYYDLKKKTDLDNQLKKINYKEDVIHDAFITFNTDNKLLPIMQKLQKHDESSFLHCYHVFYLWGAVAQHLFPKDYSKYLCPAWTHDIGKLKIKKNILTKPSKLNKREFSQVKNHTTEGAKILADNGFYLEAYFALEHHSNFHKNKHLTEEIKLFMVLDQLSAVTISRPYHEHNPLSIHGGLEELSSNPRNKDVLDQEIVKEVKKVIL
jgi:response regulator RpfG family c-di-GMP phosphodiesterase